SGPGQRRQFRTGTTSFDGPVPPSAEATLRWTQPCPRTPLGAIYGASPTPRNPRPALAAETNPPDRWWRSVSRRPRREFDQTDHRGEIDLAAGASSARSGGGGSRPGS